MNLFTGMTDHEVISSILEFALFNAFVVLEVVALAAFYVASRPRRGRVLTASLWYVLAAVVFMLCLISTVWAAPAEKAFIDATQIDEPFFNRSADHFQKVIWGAGFAFLGVVLMMVGAFHSGLQRRRIAQHELLAG
jgi:hypothetical protein